MKEQKEDTHFILKGIFLLIALLISLITKNSSLIVFMGCWVILGHLELMYKRM